MNGAYNSTLLLNIAIAQTKLSRKDEAIKSLGLALKYNPKYAKAYVKRGEIRLTMEDYNEALRDFTSARDHDPSGFNIDQKIKEC